MAAEHRIGYIDIYKTKQGEYLGGVLITDNLGIPIEFRHTETVSPSKVQQVLYGQALERFLKCETLAKCLLKEMEHKPSLLVVPDDEYYSLTKMFNYPFVQLALANREPMKQHGDFAEVTNEEIHLQLLTLRQPIRVRVGRSGAPTMNAVKDLLIDLGRTMDVLEPLARVRDALKTLIAEV